MILLKNGHRHKLFPVISFIIVLVSRLSLESKLNSIRVLYELYATEAVHIFQRALLERLRKRRNKIRRTSLSLT